MKKIFFSVITAVVVAVILLIININQKREINKKNIAYDNINKFITHTIKSEKTEALSLALAMSKNRAITDAILENSRQKGYVILHDITDSFIKHLNREYIYTQVYGKGLTIFAQSWNQNTNLINFPIVREDLMEVIRTRVPKTTIDSTIPVGIKASSPIQYAGHIIGILEVTTLFDRVVQKLREHKIETIPLVNEKLISKLDPIAINPSIKEFKIVSSNFSERMVEIVSNLSKKEFDELTHTDYLHIDNLFLASYPIYNNYGKRLGYIIAIISYDDFEEFSGKQKTLLKSIFTMESTKEDIYHYVTSKNENIYKLMNPEQILRMSQKIDPKDQILFEEAAKEKLRELSKEELIDLIVHNFYKRKKEGEIK